MGNIEPGPMMGGPLPPTMEPDTFIAGLAEPALSSQEIHEIRVKDPDTGGEKGAKAEAFDLLPWDVLDEVARLYKRGAEKYAAHNWRRGYAWSLSFASLIRHARAFWGGESVDPETETHHLASVVFHAFALMYFERAYPKGDDRWHS